MVFSARGHSLSACNAALQNTTRLESKVFSLGRLYPSSLVEASMTKKTWVQKILAIKSAMGPKEILGPKKIWGSKKFQS